MIGDTVQPRILVVDDDPLVAQQLVRAARALGYPESSSMDPLSLDPGLPIPCDVLLLDLMMPTLDGIEVLRSLALVQAPPAIVLISGLDRRTLETARKMAGANGLEVLGVLQKPCGLADLREVLARYSDRRTVVVPARVDVVPLSNVTEADVQAALTRGEFTAHFQPQVSLADGSWLGVEALARWEHPLHGLLYPDSFIRHAESERLALPFARVILETALRELTKLEHETGFRGTLSVNVSPRALGDHAFSQQVLGSLQSAGVEPSRLILEITETAVAASEAVALDIQTRLRMRGVRISIDDFGTGQSSLGRLHATPFDELKIDRIFVADADSNLTSRLIVQNAIQLGRTLEMTVVAEGVETSSTYEWLRGCGCDVAQGFWIARPMSAADLRTWSGRWASRHDVDQMRPGGDAYGKTSWPSTSLHPGG